MRIRIQHLCKYRSRSGSKVLMNISQQKKSYIFNKKWMKGVQASGEAFRPKIMKLNFLLFVLLPPWIQIRIPNSDPDPAEKNQSGSIRIRIHNTGILYVTYLCISTGLVGDVERVLALDALCLSAGVAEAPGRPHRVRHPTAPLLHTAVRMICTQEIGQISEIGPRRPSVVNQGCLSRMSDLYFSIPGSWFFYPWSGSAEQWIHKEFRYF